MEQLFATKGDANMKNTKKYNRKRTDITVMAMVLAIRLVMEMPAEAARKTNQDSPA